MRSRGSAARCYTPPPSPPHTLTLTHPLPISLPGTNARTLHNPRVAHFTSAQFPHHHHHNCKGHGCHPGSGAQHGGISLVPAQSPQVSAVMRVRPLRGMGRGEEADVAPADADADARSGLAESAAVCALLVVWRVRTGG